jgi:hypothetical protein
MPPPRVTCCICGQEVNKAQTLYIGDGKRACRTHDGTVEKNKLEIDKLKREKEAEIKKAAQKKQRKEFTAKPKCVLCGQVGMLQEDWYTRLMIEMKKYELTHGKHINPFSDEIKRAANVLIGIPCLFYVMWRGKNTHIKIPFDAYEFVKMQQMMNPVADPVLLICQNCVTEKGFTTYSQERQDSMGELFLHAAQLIHAVVVPEIEKAAIREITESN